MSAADIRCAHVEGFLVGQRERGGRGLLLGDVAGPDLWTFAGHWVR
ncbi:MAG: hypothetical protein ACRD0K_17090 [Egibacteraceae bacterium]